MASRAGRDRYSSNFDYAGDLRGGIRLARVLGLEVSGLVTTPVVTGRKVTNLICVVDIAHPGTCVPQPMPADFTMSGAGAALVYGRSDRIRFSVGGGSYVLSKSVSTGSSTRALGILGGADGDVFSTHPRITLGIHPVFMPNVRGTNEWFLPFEVGIRAW